MVPFSFFLIFTVALHLSKVGSLIVRSKVDHYFFIVAGHFTFELLDAAFDNDIHELIRISLLIDSGSWLKFLELAVIKYFPSFLCIDQGLHLFRIMKNLLKFSIRSNLSIFRFPGGNLNSYRMALMFSKL